MADDEIKVAGHDPDELRQQALSSLKRKRNFQQSLVAYVIVNAFLVVIWAVSGAEFFWPVFVLGGWGIGLVFQAYDAYGRSHTVTEDRVQEEIRKIQGP